MPAYPRIIAHRCGGALAPENTLAGLRIASRLGVRGVEFDVMLTADGVPVLIHDETMERTTSGLGRVADQSAVDWAALDAGSMHHRAFAVEPAPTFAAALNLCRTLGLWANVEIKPSTGCDAETGRAVALALFEAAADRVVLSSFSLPALQAAAKAAPQLRRALLVESIPPDWRQQMSATGAIALHAANEALEQSPGQWREVISARIPLAVYTVNQTARAAELFAAGACAIFTDRPDLWLPGEM